MPRAAGGTIQLHLNVTVVEPFELLATIRWGDGTSSSVTWTASGTSIDDHTYTTPGSYVVAIDLSNKNNITRLGECQAHPFYNTQFDPVDVQGGLLLWPTVVRISTR